MPDHASDGASELCLTLKALFSLPLRQATGLVASLLKLAGLDWPVPDDTTLCRRFDRQITELKVRAAILNRFSQIGTPNTIRAA